MDDTLKRNIIIVIIITLVIIILSVSSYYNRADEEWLVCSKTTNDQVFTDTLKFKYEIKNKILRKYYRIEEYKPKSTSSYDEILNNLNELKDGLENNKYFKYEIKEDAGLIQATTEIDILYLYELFDSYMEDKAIDSSMSLKQIMFVLEEDDFSCKLSKKVSDNT